MPAIIKLFLLVTSLLLSVVTAYGEPLDEVHFLIPAGPGGGWNGTNRRGPGYSHPEGTGCEHDFCELARLHYQGGAFHHFLEKQEKEIGDLMREPGFLEP